MIRTLPLLLLASCAIAPPEPFTAALTGEGNTFIIYGDTRTKHPLEVWRKGASRERNLVIEQLTREQPAFLLNTGDLIQEGGSRRHWEKFDREHAPLRNAGIPVFAALGNHEYTGIQSTAMNNFFARFPALNESKWFQIRQKRVVVLVLDSNHSHLTRAELEKQSAWFSRKLTDTDSDDSVDVVIVATHHPAFTNSKTHGGSAWVETHVVKPAARFAKVRAFLAGHSHTYERFRKYDRHYIVSGGGGAPLMSVGTGPNQDLYDGPRRFHYVKFTIAEEITAEVIMLGEDGSWSRVDEFSV